MTKNYITLLSATALVSASSIAQAGNLNSAITEADPVAALSQLATFAGTTGTGAYSFTPTWSEELGFAASGALGYTLSDRSAVGLLATAGQRQREVLLNFGLALDAERQIVFSGGQLQEKLEFGTDGAQEWVKQAAYGVAYDASNYSLSIYHVNSESTDNFVGAKSTGAEIEGTAELSSLASLNYAAGYQSLDWDDGSEGDNGLTARLGLDYKATPDVMLNIFADHNVSENQFGLGAQWQVGAGTLNAQYTRIDGNVGTISDDNRLALMLSMPLGGSNNSGAAVTRAATGGSTRAVVASSSSLLADVMRRPDYLPQRVIVKAAEGSGGQCGAVANATIPDVGSAPYGVGSSALRGTHTRGQDVLSVTDGSIPDGNYTATGYQMVVTYDLDSDFVDILTDSTRDTATVNSGPQSLDSTVFASNEAIITLSSANWLDDGYDVNQFNFQDGPNLRSQFTFDVIAFVNCATGTQYNVWSGMDD